MSFDTDKKRYLDKLGAPDNSKKGGVDEAIWPLLNTINAREEYYTTSSCAGRISLIIEPESGKKHDTNWHYVTHDEAKWKDVQKKLQDLPEETVWFKLEAAILHVVARDEQSANELLIIARECGFKHSGLLGTNKRYILELFDDERIDVPIAVGGRLIVEEKFVQFLVEKANKKLKKARQHMEKLRKKF